MSLALKTIKKAEKLLEADRLQKIEDSVYLVYGSNDDVYQVDFTENKIKCQCKGFRIKSDCYHCEAVRRKESLK